MTTPDKTQTLFKRDTNGTTRVWWAETDGEGSWRTNSGVDGGKITSSGWKAAPPKSRDTAEEQAVFEMEALYRKKVEQGGFALDVADSGKTFPVAMLAQKYDPKKVVGKTVFVQPKLDGIRCLATAEGLTTRNGKAIVAVPHVSEALAALFETYPDLVLDGELYNHDLRDDFNSITSAVRKTKPKPEDFETARIVEYHVYDVVTGEDFSGRIGVLEQHPEVFGGTIRLVETTLLPDGDTGELDRLYSEYLEAGYEGQMVRLDGPYEGKRSKLLMKRKEFLDGEFEIVRIEEGIGNWAGKAKRLVFLLPDGRECGSGIAGSAERAERLLAEADRYVGSQATIRYFTPTPDGFPRFPVCVDLHLDGRED